MSERRKPSAVQAVVLAGCCVVALTAPGAAQERPAAGQQAFIQEQRLGNYSLFDMIGTTVIGANGHDTGTIHDFYVEPGGRVTTAIISVGGVLGIGDKLVGVPFDLLEFSSRTIATTRNLASNDETVYTGASRAYRSMTATRDAFITRGGDPDHVVLRVTEDQLKNAPTFRAED